MTGVSYSSINNLAGQGLMLRFVGRGCRWWGPRLEPGPHQIS